MFVTYTDGRTESRANIFGLDATTGEITLNQEFSRKTKASRKLVKQILRSQFELKSGKPYD